MMGIQSTLNEEEYPMFIERQGPVKKWDERQQGCQYNDDHKDLGSYSNSTQTECVNPSAESNEDHEIDDMGRSSSTQNECSVNYSDSNTDGDWYSYGDASQNDNNHILNMANTLSHKYGLAYPYYEKKEGNSEKIHRNDHTQETATQLSPRKAINSATTNDHNVSIGQERKILLLMLLAQVCALHDSTPKTFIIHVLSLYERGILDYENIEFLFDLELVPRNVPAFNSSLSSAAHPPCLPVLTDGCIADFMGTIVPFHPSMNVKHSNTHTENQILSTEISTKQHPKANDVTPHQFDQIQMKRRSQQVSAIREYLERQESFAFNNKDIQLQIQNKRDGSDTMVRRSSSSDLLSSTQPFHYPSLTSSWSVEHHPLFLSRYKRDFVEKSLLGSGAFGKVYRATNKLDSNDYAIKRVTFSAKGYDTKQIEIVIREVHCLAQMDHAHVTRYYTSWLEPSWMTGGAAIVSANKSDVTQGNNEVGVNEPNDIQRQLLMDVHRLVLTSDNDSIFSSSSSCVLGDEHINRNSKHADMSDCSVVRNHDTLIGDSRSRDKGNTADLLHGISTGDYGDDEDSICSEWTNDQSFDGGRSCDAGNDNDGQPKEIDKHCNSYCSLWNNENTGLHSRECESGTMEKKQHNYKYQIYFFIQMQLCDSSTLADWIRCRNIKYPCTTTKDCNMMDYHLYYALPSLEILEQIVSGIAHVHSKGIVHRDLKPGNIFASGDGGTQIFKLGDFGLSKLLRSAHHDLEFDNLEQGCETQYSTYSQTLKEFQDPLTLGIGTASYASPEQIASQSYGREADIFSLGLIILEMFCNFGSEHERATIFHDCRCGQVPPTIRNAYPKVASLILQCTHSEPAKRPSANVIHSLDISNEMRSEELYQADMNSMRLELKQKNAEIEMKNNQLAEKDTMVQEQKKEIEALLDALGTSNQ